jgi:hypothetical protein
VESQLIPIPERVEMITRIMLVAIKKYSMVFDLIPKRVNNTIQIFQFILRLLILHFVVCLATRQPYLIPFTLDNSSP